MLWGLDAEGRFYGSVPSHSSTPSQLCGGTAKPNVYNIIIEELRRLRAEEERHTSFIESETVSDSEKERRLIHWFQCDLLPGVSGQILASKCARDHTISEVKLVSFEQKCLGYAVIVSLNLGMVFYIFLFALQQSNSRQSAWLQLAQQRVGGVSPAPCSWAPCPWGRWWSPAALLSSASTAPPCCSP